MARADHSGQLLVEHRLPGEHPAGDAADRDRARTAEQVALGPRRVAFDGRRRNDQQSGQDCQMTAPGIERTLHGHCTRMLLANSAPMPTKASEATNDLLRFCDDKKCGSSGFSVQTAHDGGAPISLTGFFLAKAKSMKNSGS